MSQEQVLLTGIILAGGRGSRLGRGKALERVTRQSLIERVADCLELVSSGTIVVTSQEQFEFIRAVKLKANVVVDLYSGKGALGGIYTGLKSASTPYSLVVACDMPFLNPDLLGYLIGLASGSDAVVPRIGDMYEPLHAVYSKNCITAIGQLLWQEEPARISELFGLVKTRYVDADEIAKFDPEHLSFFNINTQSDLRKAEALIRHEDSF